jgi:hypothetical protein
MAYASFALPHAIANGWLQDRTVDEQVMTGGNMRPGVSCDDGCFFIKDAIDPPHLLS